jgi:hypothetical protein
MGASETGAVPGGVSFLPAHFVRGDVDTTGGPNLADITLLLKALFLGESRLPCRDAADVNDDGVVEITDAVLLIEHLYQSGAPPRAPYPAPGMDPAAGGSLGCDEPLPFFREGTGR